jgi:hypothetical protein
MSRNSTSRFVLFRGPREAFKRNARILFGGARVCMLTSQVTYEHFENSETAYYEHLRHPPLPARACPICIVTEAEKLFECTKGGSLCEEVSLLQSRTISIKVHGLEQVHTKELVESGIRCARRGRRTKVDTLECDCFDFSLSPRCAS